jgi:hypothetical protein
MRKFGKFLTCFIIKNIFKGLTLLAGSIKVMHDSQFIQR